jgi:hypothetical protein
MESRLLQLPGELRNKVFEYALTLDDGVCYREDNLGVGWLCHHPQQSDPDTNEHAPTPTAAARVTVNGHVVANQLQFVCHQLRNESRGLVIRYNDIHILDAPHHCRKFVYSVDRHDRRWIQKIIERIDSTHTAGWTNYSHLSIDWKTHPKFMVHAHHPEGRLENNRFFEIAKQVQVTGRRNREFLHRLIQDYTIHPCFYGVGVRLPKIPSYVKVFPWDKEFNEAAIRRYCEGDGPEQRFYALTAPGGVEGLVAIAKEWFENGY